MGCEANIFLIVKNCEFISNISHSLQIDTECFTKCNQVVEFYFFGGFSEAQRQVKQRWILSSCGGGGNNINSTPTAHEAEEQ